MPAWSWSRSSSTRPSSGRDEDFERYPRTLDDDIELCRGAGADLVFAPDAAAVYPHGPRSTFVEVPGLSDVLEGASRPGHFRGVATVVLKLFEIVRPDLAVFGRKDYQQQLVIRRMVADLHLPVEIVTERDGPRARRAGDEQPQPLPESDERRAATILHRALERAKEAVAGGERDANRVRQILRQTIESRSVSEARLCRGRGCRHARDLWMTSPATPGRGSPGGLGGLDASHR